MAAGQDITAVPKLYTLLLHKVVPSHPPKYTHTTHTGNTVHYKVTLEPVAEAKPFVCTVTVTGTQKGR